MKYNNIFVCHNLTTVYKAFQFIKDMAEDSCLVLYLDYSVKIPKDILDSLPIRTIESGSNSGNWLKRTLNTAVYKSKTCKIINENTNHNSALYVFLDNVLLMTSIIESYKKKHKSSTIYLIEEGAGLYTKKDASKPYRDRGIGIKKLIYTIIGLSTYSIERKKQGENPLVDCIVCSDINKYKRTGKLHNQTLIEFKEEYSKEKCLEIITMLPDCYRELVNKLKKYNYIFISEPIYDIVGKSIGKELLEKIMRCLGNHGTVLYKAHPRDTEDYSFLCSNSVQLLPDELKQIPFEWLSPFFSDSQMVTFHSSVVLNIKTNHKPIMLYKLLENEYISSIVENSDYNWDEIVTYENMKELEHGISSK